MSPRPLSPENSEKIQLAMMGPSRRLDFQQRKAQKQKQAEAAKRFLCSVVLSQETHDLLQHYAMDMSATYDGAIHKAIMHCRRCFHDDDVPDEEEEEK